MLDLIYTLSYIAEYGRRYIEKNGGEMYEMFLQKE